MEKKISKIVVVDSNEKFCENLKSYFLESRADLRVVATYNNIIDAVEYVSDNSVDIIITDLVIPNADGFDLITEIKRLGLEKTPKIIVVTEQVPVYDNVLVVTLFQPTLEDTVADQGEQITEIQEVLAEII